MKTTKFLMLTLMTAMIAVMISACSDDDGDTGPDTPEPGEATIRLEGEVTSNRTLYADTIYILGSRVTVVDGVELTIEAGTIIKGDIGSGANASSLLIAQGGKLFANGTADNPIIMTSIADDIVQGEIASPNQDPILSNGLWGGLIILGKAPISADAVPAQIEGIPPSDSNGQYGGDIANDNSGSIQYVSIRHGGANIGEGNEINGLTLGGVGSGTTISYIEVIANQDDGLECFGGTVNVSNILIWAQGDDAYDMDQAYSGTVDNFIYIAGPESDHAMELDGPEGSASGAFTLTNGSLKGFTGEGGGGREYIDFRDGVLASVENTYFFNFLDNSDVEIDDDVSSANWKANPATLDVSGLEFNTSHLSSGNLTIDDIFADKSEAGDAFTTRAPDATIVTTPTVGATVSRFTGWTWADAAGELADF